MVLCRRYAFRRGSGYPLAPALIYQNTHRPQCGFDRLCDYIFLILTEKEYPLTDVCRSCHIILCELASGKPKSERVHTSFLTHVRKSQLFLIVLIVVARLGFAQGAGVHQWKLPMHNFNTLQYVSHTSHILTSLDLGLTTSPVALHRSDSLQSHAFPGKDGYSFAIPPLIRTPKIGGSFHVV